MAKLALEVEEVEVERLQRPAPNGGRRTTAVVHMTGGGLEGRGEEVTFQEPDLLRDLGPISRRLAGVRSLGDVWLLLDDVDLFARPPQHAVVRNYRRWAVEAAALDLALRQASLTLSDVAGRGPEPVRFVVSPASGMLHRFPGARLKVDAADLEPGLPVDVVDFKAAGSLALVEQVLDLYPDALLEDPPTAPRTGRVSLDIGICSAADVERLDARPAAVNVKPARVGGVRALLELYELCGHLGIPVYGGGQHELGPGRFQIQLLAALFHPDAPNDVAPAGYNEPEPRPGLPSSPLNLPERAGFG